MIRNFVKCKQVFVLRWAWRLLSKVGSSDWIPWLRTAFVFKRSWLHLEGKAWKCVDNSCIL